MYNAVTNDNMNPYQSLILLCITRFTAAITFLLREQLIALVIIISVPWLV